MHIKIAATPPIGHPTLCRAPPGGKGATPRPKSEDPQELQFLPKSEDPTFPFATFAVVAVLPGSSPTDVERLVVDPLENKLNGLEDVKAVRTEIEDGVAVIRVEFRAGSDATEKRDAVLREVGALRPTLPAELARLGFGARVTSSNGEGWMSVSRMPGCASLTRCKICS